MEEPIYELGIFKPRTVKFKGIVKGAFWRIPLEAYREMVREICAFYPGPVGP